MTFSRTPARRSLALAVLLAQASALVVMGAPVARAGSLPPSEWVIGPMDRVAFLTFDGPTTGDDLAAVLDVLDRKGARASFFLSGAWVSGHHEVVRRVKRADHVLGNAGYGPAPFTRLDATRLRRSIARGQAELNELGVGPAPFLRGPEGARGLRVLQTAGAMGYRFVRWTHHPGGGRAQRVERRVVREARSGSIIALDLERTSHVRALDGIIDGLRRRDFKLATIERLKRVHAVRWDVTLRAGSSGSEVAYLQKALSFLSYPAGGRDGSFGADTQQGVYAFEKVNRLTRDGVVPPWQMAMIAAGRRPKAPARAPQDFVDVDISRQVLFEVRDGRVTHTLPISSGNEEYYTVDGQTYRAHTPRGSFTVERKIPGERHSRLGTLYYPSYFVGGYAIHGSQSVPVYPASHGCVRIPMFVHKAFYYRNPVGMPVFVHN
ncbi:MAG: polysaccharide deacetylase family protein [Actinomycetota bacterium]